MQTRRGARKSVQHEESAMFLGKRKGSPTGEISKIQKKTFEGREVDMYCWICHKIGQNLVCNSCPRVYHSECTRKAPIDFNTQGSCAECQCQSITKGNEPTNINRLRLRELLKFALQEALRDDVKKPVTKSQSQPTDNKFCKYFKSWPAGIRDSLCQIIDLDILIDKMNDDINYYLTTAEFFADVKWIYHNSYILHGVDSEITETALKLEKKIKKELLDIEACAECYYIKHSDEYVDADFFTLICKKPHDIIWAKLRGSPYWPAKCLKVNGGQADVRFFGTHDKSIVPISQCYRISENSPIGKSIKQSKYVHAVNELAAYIQNYENQIGDFQYYPPRTPLDNSKIQNIRKNTKKGGRQNNLEDDSQDCIQQLSAEYEALYNEPPPLDLIEADCTPTVSIEAKSELAQYIDRDFPDVDSSTLDSVSVSMEFSTDDENILFTTESSPISSSASLNDISVKNSSASGGNLETNNSVEQLSAGTSHFLGSDTCDLLPVITSAASELGSSNDNTITNSPDLLQTLSDILSNTASSSKAGDAATSNILNEPIKDFRAENDEDDLIIEHEKIAPPTAVNAVMNNPYLVHALSELVQSNHPHLQEFHKRCMDFGLKSFLQLWLSSILKWQDPNAVVMFANLYEKISTTNNNIKKDNEELRNVNKALTQENIALKEEIQNVKKQLTINEEKKKLEERLTNTKRVISMLLTKFHPELESFENEELDENLLLAKKVKQFQEVILEKDAEIKKLENELQSLQNHMQSIEETLISSGEIDLDLITLRVSESGKRIAIKRIRMEQQNLLNKERQS